MSQIGSQVVGQVVGQVGSPVDVFGLSRSVVRRDHALITPESHVPAAHPAWSGARTVTLVSPHLGARFSQYLALLGPASRGAPAAPGVERFVFVLEGTLRVGVPGSTAERVVQGDYVYLPPDAPHEIESPEPARLLVFEQSYVPLTGAPPPEFVRGTLDGVAGVPFLGDPGALLQALLPDAPAFDLAINVFSFQPGACLPLVEVHYMEHGLLVLEGAGVYRLGECWYPVKAGDALWMAPYCPQWFAAVGKTPARYIYYKDANRDPLGRRD